MRPSPQRLSPLGQSLLRPLVEELRAEVRLTLRVADMKEQGYTQAEIEADTGATPAEIRSAVARLRRIAPRLEREDSPFAEG